MKRRQFLQTLGWGSAAALVAASAIDKVALGTERVAAAASAPGATYPFALPPLPYGYDALEPHIDSETMFLHHTAHHGAAVNSLNNALRDHPTLHNRLVVELLANINTVPQAIRTTVRNSGGSHLNHMIFWATMGPTGTAGGEPTGTLAQALATTFGSFAVFRQQFTDAANRLFGSGWTWLVLDQTAQPRIVNYPNQDSPVMDGLEPLVGIDMWEHAYYLKHRNRRANYVGDWWNTVNWEAVGMRYAHARG